MAYFDSRIFLLGIILFAHLISAIPPGSRSSSCSQSECPNAIKFRYNTGKSYSYRYEMDVSSFVDGTSSNFEESRIHMTAKVHFDVHTSCDWTLRISDVTLQDSEPTDPSRKTSVPSEAAFQKTLMQNALPFTFQDGQVPHICPAPEDPVWSVNIKRGILSTIQNLMPRFDLDYESLRETDVSGTCRVNYAFLGAVQNAINVLKTRDLASCSNRYGKFHFLTGTPYHFIGPSYESVPLTNSTSSCQQTIAAKRITQSECDEKHVVQPFSHDGSGATTTVRQMLTFLEELEIDDTVILPTKMSPRSTLLFHHAKVQDSSTVGDSVLSLPNTLQRLCQNTEEGVDTEAASLFGRVVNALRSMDYQALVNLMGDAENSCHNGQARKYLLDGLISAATSDAVAAMRDEINTGTVKPDVVNRWIKSLAFIPKPNVKHLLAALPLLDVPLSSRPHQASLSISSLAKKLCSNGCPPELSELISKLSEPLGISCGSRSREEREEVILSLKSLANVGAAIKGGHLETIENCFKDKDNAVEVRIAAIQALRNVPCQTERVSAMKILSDSTEDSEIRIAAYLAILKCPDYKSFTSIKDLLAKEEINQVGSFIWTHLRNLATSSLPSKLEVQALLLEQTLVSKFDTDARKFSRNYEKSILFDQYNAAASLESNVIFSQHSYLPRSTSFNFTVDIFGQSINLFEFDGRFEGFEHYFESLFGPGGMYQQKELGYLLQGLRTKRKVNPTGLNYNKLNAMDKQFNAASHFSDEPEMSLSMKVFGSEISYGHWEGRKEIFESISGLSPVSKLQKLMNGEENQFSYASQFVDSTQVIPLSSGLPMNLMARGQVVSDLRGSLRTDLRSILNNGKGEIVWKVHPSAVVSFDGAMTVDAVAIHAGVKLSATLHSSVSTSGKFALDGLGLIDLKIDLPQDKADILNVKSDIVLQHRRVQVPLTGIRENRVEVQSCTRGHRSFGVEICTEFSYPNASEEVTAPHFPLTGPAHFNFQLSKSDASITSYRFLHKIENEEKLKAWTLTFCPEGSLSSKELGFKSRVTYAQADSGLVEFNLMMPSNSYDMKGNFKIDDETKSFEASFIRDKTNQVLVAKAGLIRLMRSKQQVYQPQLILTLNNRNITDLGGEIKLTEKKGTIKYDVDINAKLGSWNTGTKGYYLQDEKSHVSNLTLEYKTSPKDRAEKIKIEVKLNNGSTQGLRQFDVHFGVQPSAFPSRNFVGTWRLQQGLGHLENQWTFNTGLASRDNRNTLTITQSLNYLTGSLQRLRSRFQVTLPVKNIDLAVILGHEQTDYKSDTHFIGRYATGKEIQVGFLAQKKPGVILNANGAFNLTLPSQPIIKCSGQIEEKSKNNYKIDADGVWGEDTDFQLSASYDSQVKSTHSSEDLRVEVTGSTINPVELTYAYQTNQTSLQAQIQSSYGKDSISLYLVKNRPSKDEWKMGTKIGYLNYQHTVDVYWKDVSDEQKGVLDVHLDKVLDIRGDFNSDVAADGRRDTLLDLRWDANRDPSQKLTLKTSYQPTGFHPNDWNSVIHFSYPGTFIKGNLAALTEKNNRSISGAFDFGSKKPVVLSLTSSRVGTSLMTELLLDTPFHGWASNKVVFISETKGLKHKTDFQASWGMAQYVEAGVEARVENGAEAKIAEASVHMKSSFERLENFKVDAKTEMQPKMLDNSIKFQWGDDQEMGLQSNLEWSLDGQLMLKNTIAVTTPFPQLSQVKLEMYNNLEWEAAHLFESRSSLDIDRQKYTLLVKGESPSVTQRWETSVLLTTPYPKYSNFGLLLHGSNNERKPSFDLQLNLPNNQMAVNVAGDFLIDGQRRASLKMKTPFEHLRTFTLDGLYTSPAQSDSTRSGIVGPIKIDLGTKWNTFEFITFNTSYEMDSLTSADLMADFKSSFWGHEHYATRLAGNVDLVTQYPSAGVVINVIYPLNQFGFSANGSMTQTDDGSSASGAAKFEMKDYPDVMIEFNHDLKESMDFKSSLLISKSGDSYNLNADLTTTDGVMLLAVNVMTPLYELSESELQLRFRKEYLTDPTSELLGSIGAMWKSFGQSTKLAAHLNYFELSEELEDFAQRATTNFEFNLHSPWEPLDLLIANVRLVNQNSEVEHAIELALGNNQLTVNGTVNFETESASMIAIRKSATLSKPQTYRMNTTWTVLDEQIKAEGTLTTNIQGFSRIPWNVDITIKDSEEDENAWERLLSGEAHLSKSQSIVINGLWQATKLSGNLASPFESFKKVDLNIDFESYSNLVAECHINEDNIKLVGNLDWPQDNPLPIKAELTLTTPYEFELVVIDWKSEDPYAAAKMSASLTRASEPYRFDGHYDVTSLEKVEIQLKMTAAFVSTAIESCAFQLNSEISDNGISGYISLNSPFTIVKNVEVYQAFVASESTYKTSIVLDSAILIGKIAVNYFGQDGGDIRGDANVDIPEICKIFAEFSLDPEYKRGNVEASAFDWRLKSTMEQDEWRKYVMNTQVAADLDRQWLLDLELDLKQLTSLYHHNITYRVVHDQLTYTTYGFLEINDVQYHGRVGADWPGTSSPLELNFTSTKIEKLLGTASIQVVTPWTRDPSLSIVINVDDRVKPTEVKIQLETTEKLVVVDMDIQYKSIAALAAKTTVTTKFSWLPKFMLHINSQNVRNTYNGSYILEWPDNHMIDVYLQKQTTDAPSIMGLKNIQSVFRIKSSWSPMPEASVHFTRDIKSPLVTISRVRIFHNYTEMIDALYNSTIKSSNGMDLEEGQIEMRGLLVRGGFAFSRLFTYSGGKDGDNFPRSLTRSLEFFEVGSRPKFHMRTQMIQKETETGEQYVFKISNPHRTIDFSTHVDFPDGVFKHGAEFRWRPDARVAYEIDIENRTTATTTDYVMTTTVFTPVRNLGVTGTLRQTKRIMRAVAEIVWDLNRRESVAKITTQWENITKTRDVLSDKYKFSFSQGTLPQELAFITEVHRNASVPLNMNTVIQYSKDASRNIHINSLIRLLKGKFRAEMNVTHEATGFDMRQLMYYERSPAGRSQLVHSFWHSRSDSELIVMEHMLAVDPTEKKIFFSGSSPSMTMRHQAQLASRVNQTIVTYEAQYDDGLPRITELVFNSHLPLIQFVSQYDPENGKALHLKAGIPNKRQVMLQIYDQNDLDRFTFFDFVFRLNHSRLITSKTQWPKDLYTRAYDRYERSRDSVFLTADQWVGAFPLHGFSESAGSILIIADDIMEILEKTLSNFVDEIDKLNQDGERMKQNIIDGYYGNAFFAKTAVNLFSMVFKDFSFESYTSEFVASFKQTWDRLLEPLTKENDSFTRWLNHVNDKLIVVSETISGWLGDQWKWPANRSSQFVEQITSIFKQMAAEYDRFIKELHENLLETFSDIGAPLRNLARDSWREIYGAVRPLVIRTLISIESATWNVMKEVLDYFYEQRDAVVQSTYYQRLAHLLDDLQQFYTDMQDIDWPSKVRKYLSRASQFLQQKYLDIDEYLVWLSQLRAELEIVYQGFLKDNPDLQKGVDNGQKLVAFLHWSYNYLKIDERLPRLLAAIREKGPEILSQTATDAQMRYSPQKTLFRFNPEHGSIELEQKLPFPWISFDEKPRLDQLPEIERINSFLALFQPSNISAVDQLLSYVPSKMQLTDLLPPFKGSAHFVGLQHFLTFDGRYYEFTGPCTYLLSRDFFTRNFTLAVHYVGSRGKPYASILQLVVDKLQWDMDLGNSTIRVGGVSRLLPTEEKGTSAFFEDGKFVIESSSKGIRLECIAMYEVCTFTLSGWHNNKVAGLLGTMDNEAINDQIRPDRVIDFNLPSLARSWDVSANEECKTVENLARKSVPADDKLIETCDSLFNGPRSTFKKCLPIVDPAPFLRMCTVKTRAKTTVQDGCHAAAAYVASCVAKGLFVRIPPHCVKCMMNNDLLSEGESKELRQEKNTRPSSDVVLLLEMKKCNEPDTSSPRFLPSLLGSLEKELNTQKIIKNRYSLVLFGGPEPYNLPTVRTLNGQDFVAAKELDNLFHNISFGDGTASVLSALRFATQLNFRAGASKTFILLPCSSCDTVQEDYGVFMQSLIDQDVTLHILTDAEFRFTKSNASRQFLGLDATTGFTPKEVKGRVVGDSDLRRQAKLPTSVLGLCAPLALGTNGTIFTASRMRDQRKNTADSKRAVNIWVKRMTATANPSDCHQCTCSIKKYHQSMLDCRTCTAREATATDTSFLVNDSALQSMGKNLKSRLREEDRIEEPKDFNPTEEA